MKGVLFLSKMILKGKGLDLGLEPPGIKLCLVAPGGAALQWELKWLSHLLLYTWRILMNMVSHFRIRSKTKPTRVSRPALSNSNKNSANKRPNESSSSSCESEEDEELTRKVRLQYSFS